MTLDELKRKLKLWGRSVRFFWQRITRGWSDNDTWSLDHSFAKLIAPRLRRFKELNFAHPADLTFDEWEVMLDKMIYSFEFGASEKRWNCFDIEEWQKVQEGIDLFGKYFFELWW